MGPLLNAVTALDACSLLTAAALLLAVFVWRVLWVDPRVRKGAAYVPERYPLEHTLDMVVDMERQLQYFTAIMLRHPHTTFSVKLLGQPRFFFTHDEESIRYILKTDFPNFPKGGRLRRVLRRLLGDGIFTTDGNAWYAHRKISSKLFSTARFRTTVLHTFNAHYGKLRQSLYSSSAVVDIQNLLHAYTLDSIGEIAFGLEIGALADGDNCAFARAFDYCQAYINESFFTPVWVLARFLTARGWRFGHNLAVLDRDIRCKVRERMQDRTRGNTGDLLGLFFDHEDMVTGSLDETALRDIMLNFIIAGRDTTAMLMSWTLFELSQRPDVAARVRAEAEVVCGEELRVPTPEARYEELCSLPYLDAVLTETLRLHPSVPKNVRQAARDTTLPDGTVVPRGSWVGYLSWGMGRHPSLWEEPLQFDPDRFFGQPKPSPFKLPSFHAGQRMCLGKDLAMLEAKLLLSRLLRDFDFELACDPASVTHTNSLTLPIKGGLPLKLTPRGSE